TLAEPPIIRSGTRFCFMRLGDLDAEPLLLDDVVLFIRALPSAGTTSRPSRSRAASASDFWAWKFWRAVVVQELHQARRNRRSLRHRSSGTDWGLQPLPHKVSCGRGRNRRSRRGFFQSEAG